MVGYDEYLVSEAERLASAQIHDVKCVVSIYSNWLVLYARDKKEQYLDSARIYERILRAFVAERSMGGFTSIEDIRSRILKETTEPSPFEKRKEKIDQQVREIRFKNQRDRIRKEVENRIRSSEPALDATEVADFLGSRSSTNPRLASEHRKRGDLLGVKVSGKYLYPTFQFDKARQEVYPIVKEINTILSSKSDAWAVLDWWVSPNARLRDAVAPKELLLDPEKHIVLKSLAEALVEDAG